MGNFNLELVEFEKINICDPGSYRILVDSELAREILTFNINNRRLRPSWVNHLTRLINNSEWRDDHPQPIVFSSKGKLIDGQHRLSAISKSNIKETSIIVRVETGADESIREYLDTGIVRMLDDRVQFHEDLNINKRIAQLITTHFEIATGKRVKPSPEAAKAYFRKHKEACFFVAGTNKKQRILSSIAIAYAALEHYEINQEKARLFYPDIFVKDSEIQQARMLRDYLLRIYAHRQNARTGGGAAKMELYGKSISCMKAFNESREIKVVRASKW